MTPNTHFSRILVLLTLVMMISACTSMDYQRNKYPDPNDRLDQLLLTYQKARNDGSDCRELWKIDHAGIDCERLLREVGRLYAEFPNNERVLMSNATMNYEVGRIEKAQYYLDQLLSHRGARPEAAVLRSQIAMQQGNTAFAVELMDRQIMMAPDHYELREAQAAAFYLQGKYDSARAVLAVAGRMGAPGWRLSYHHGLICEAEHQWQAACRFYNTALEQKPDYSPALARLIGLTEHEECRGISYFDHVDPIDIAPANAGYLVQ